MTFEILALNQGPRHTFIWNSRDRGIGQAAPKTSAQRLASVTLPSNQGGEATRALESAATILDQLRRAVTDGAAPDRSSGRSLEELGRLLFSQVLPADLQTYLRSLPTGAYLCITANEPALPWELLHDGGEFLALRLAMARRLLTEQATTSAMNLRLRKLSCLLVGNPTGELLAADEEVEALLDIMDASPLRPRVEFLLRDQASKMRVLSALASERYDIIHFACHARPDALQLADDWVSADEIRAALAGGPLVFLNACSSARLPDRDSPAEFGVGSAGVGLAHTFVAAGALAFVGTLWPILDARASQLAIDFYRAIFNGQALGEALRQARHNRRVAAPDDSTWAAPILYGDPQARVAHGGVIRQPGSVLVWRRRLDAIDWQEQPVDEDESAASIQEEVAQLAHTIVAHGGTVISLSADQVIAAFGVPHPYEDDAVRAVRAALAIKAKLDIPAMCMGVASGDLMLATVLSPHQGDDMGRNTPLLLGAAYREAAQLVALAQPRQLLATERTRRFAKNSFPFVRVAADPLVAYEVGSAVDGTALTQIRSQTPQHAMVGREREMEVLTAYWRSAREGRGLVLGIVGEAGVGKTRLLQELRRSLADGEMIWLEASCRSTDRDVPYALIGQLLRQMFGIDASDSAGAVEAKIGRSLEELSPSSVDDPQLVQILNETLGLSSASFPLEERRARRGRLVHLLRTLMARAAQVTPLCVAVDDIQWIDDASLEILVQVTDGIDRLRVAMVTLYRPEWRHPWFEKPYYRHLVLEQLNEADCANLLLALLGVNQLVSDFAPILAAVGGNPFFMEEMVRSLQESGLLARHPAAGEDQGTWELRQPLTEAHLPETVERTLLVRLDRLPPDVRRILQGAAVIGPGFSAALLGLLLSDPQAAVAQKLGELEERDFILSTWGERDYHFRHALVLEAAYASVPGEQRQALHRRLAEILEDNPSLPLSTVENLAHQRYHSLVVSRPGEAIRLDVQAAADLVMAALDPLQHSGRRALERFAAREALTHFRRALDVAQLQPDADGVRVAILEGIGDAHNILGDFDAAYAQLRRAYAGLHTHPLSREERRHAADLARRLGRLCMWKGEHETALAWVAEGQRELGDSADREDKVTAALLHIHKGSIHYNRGQLDEATRAIEVGLTLALESDEATAQAEAYNLLAIILWARGDNRTALGYFEQSLRNWQSVGNSYQAARVEGNIGVVNFHMAEWDVAQRFYTACQRYWESIGDRDMLALTQLNSGNVRLCRGMWSEAQSDFESALTLWESVQNQRWIALCHINLGHLAVARQEWQAADEHFVMGHTLLDGLSIRDLLPETYTGQAEVALGTGRPQVGLELGRQARELAQGLDLKPEHAAALRVLGRAHLALGMHAEAVQTLGESLAIFRSLANTYESGRTLYHLTQAESACGARMEALEHIDTAIEIFETLRARHDLALAHASQTALSSTTTHS